MFSYVWNVIGAANRRDEVVEERIVVDRSPSYVSRNYASPVYTTPVYEEKRYAEPMIYEEKRSYKPVPVATREIARTDIRYSKAVPIEDYKRTTQEYKIYNTDMAAYNANPVSPTLQKSYDYVGDRVGERVYETTSPSYKTSTVIQDRNWEYAQPREYETVAYSSQPREVSSIYDTTTYNQPREIIETKYSNQPAFETTYSGNPVYETTTYSGNNVYDGTYSGTGTTTYAGAGTTTYAGTGTTTYAGTGTTTYEGNGTTTYGGTTSYNTGW